MTGTPFRHWGQKNSLQMRMFQKRWQDAHSSAKGDGSRAGGWGLVRAERL